MEDMNRRGTVTPLRAAAAKGRRSTLAIVIPALNEADNIPGVMESIPLRELALAGYETEVLIVDNGSTDGTAAIARECGARVIVQPVRGYGSAYKAGFANCSADLIATGDADLTYPFEILPEVLHLVDECGLDFVSTNRLECRDRTAMTPSHVVGNVVLTAVSRALFRGGFQDSQSGMWIFRRAIWDQLHVESNGMAFSQEIKNEALVRGFRCAELPIAYRPRGGEKKLHAVRDGARNAGQLLTHRLRSGKSVAAVNANLRLPASAMVGAATIDLVAMERDLSTSAELASVAAD